MTNSNEGWISGEPTAAGWYMFAVRTNDKEERYYVLQMWYNPQAITKYWVGGGYVSNKAEPANGHFQNNVKFYQELPESPNQTP